MAALRSQAAAPRTFDGQLAGSASIAITPAAAEIYSLGRIAIERAMDLGLYHFRLRYSDVVPGTIAIANRRDRSASGRSGVTSAAGVEPSAPPPPMHGAASSCALAG